MEVHLLDGQAGVLHDQMGCGREPFTILDLLPSRMPDLFIWLSDHVSLRLYALAEWQRVRKGLERTMVKSTWLEKALS